MCFIPFRLWHIYNNEFINMIVSLIIITAGMSIGQIRCMLQKLQSSLSYKAICMLHGGRGRAR